MCVARNGTKKNEDWRTLIGYQEEFAKALEDAFPDAPNFMLCGPQGRLLAASPNCLKSACLLSLACATPAQTNAQRCIYLDGENLR